VPGARSGSFKSLKFYYSSCKLAFWPFCRINAPEATAIRPLSDEQLRALINLRPRYENLIEAQRDLARMP
jgi:hypothetical protein